MVRQLVIEYVLDGSQRGYNFTSPTDGFSEEVLKEIWRMAMPRGQGWGDPTYLGARSIKSFELSNGLIVVSDVVVTDLRDEVGRRGIRRAVVDVMTSAVYIHHLNSRIAGYPDEVLTRARYRYDRVRQSNLRLKKDVPVVLAAEFESAREWWVMEALTLMLIAHPTPPLLKLEWPFSFTTLALDHRRESTLVAMPAAKVGDVKGVSVVSW